MQSHSPKPSASKISRRAFLKGAGLAALGISMTVLGGTEFFFMVDDPDNIELVKLEIRLPSLDTAFDGFRIVQISDIHMDEWMDQTRLENILSTCQQLSPDVLVITGDFITREIKTVIPPLTRALKPAGENMLILATLGNNDYRYDKQIMHDVLKDCNIIELRNSIYTFYKNNAQLHFAGIDDIWFGKPNLSKVLDEMPPDGTGILLVHEPDFADKSSKTNRFDLQLSGHTHGGQINLPGIGTPITPPFGHKYVSGMYQVGSMIQYTNRGLGFSQMEPKVRINCPPEITQITLKS